MNPAALHAVKVAGFFILLYSLFFAPVLLSKRIMAPGDALALYLPSFLSPFSLWEPNLQGGIPVAADLQTASLYPVARLFALAGSWNAFVISGYVLLSCFTYAFVYFRTRSWVGALVSGIAAGMSGFMMAHLAHTIVTHGMAWIPLILLSMEKLRAECAIRWLAAGAVAIALSLLSGHPQIPAYGLLVAAAYALMLLLMQPAGRIRFAFLATAMVLAGAATCFGLSLPIFWILRHEFMPNQDMSRFMIRFQTSVGTSLDATDRYLRQMENYLRSRPEVALYATSIGGWGGADVNSGFAFVNMKDPQDRPVDPKLGRPLTQQEFMGVVRQYVNSIPGGRAVLQDPSQTGFSSSRGGGFPIEFNVRGPDWNVLADSVHKITEQMLESGVVTDVDSDYRVGMPEVQVIPDRNKAADLGVSMASIAETINAAIGGMRVGKFKDKGRRFDIRVRLLQQQRERPEDINRLLVRTGSGDVVRLGELIRIEQQPTLQAITRRDRERAITIFANVASGVSQDRAVEQSLSIARSVLPDGYRAIVSGTAKTYRQSFQSLWFALALGLAVAYMVLASQFNSFAHPITILAALPFSFTGALLALWVGGQSLNVYSMLGMILLMGISKKNSIMLVDFTNQFREHGIERHEALLQACPIRLRPILMTSVATIAGALPPALAIGPGAELQRPMALALVGGMAVSTLMTLFVVPAFYSVLDDFLVWMRARRHSRVALPVAQ